MVQFVTYRLADSLPRAVLSNLTFKLESKQISEIEYHRRVERFLDLGYGPLYLSNIEVAKIVEENLLRFDGERYLLLHWVIMLNHVHLLIRPQEGYSLSSIIHSLKSFTANRANKVLGKSGRFWSPEYYDRYIRSGDHFSNVVKYIHEIPVKSRLCDHSKKWAFGCARWHE